MQKPRSTDAFATNSLNRSYGSSTLKQQIFNTSSLIRTATVDVTEDGKSAESLKNLQMKNFVIKLQFAMIVLLVLAVVMLNFKVNRMCGKDPPIVCRVDL